jgi:excisionase family DNA binding protein
MNQKETYITVKETARQLGVTTRTVQNWLKAGRFTTAYRIAEGRTMPWLISLEEVQQIAESRKTK